MKRQKDDRQTVAVALWLNGLAGRDILTGIFCYARSKRHAGIRILPMPGDFSPSGVRNLVKSGVDGIIAGYLTPEETDAILGAGLPLVIVGPKDPRRSSQAGLTYIDCNDREIGELGARHLLELGAHRTYGFVGAWEGVGWSDRREEGFRATLAVAGKTAAVFRVSSHEPTAALDRKDLVSWLSELIKPAAIMAAYDVYAVQVLDACQELKLDVPRQIAVLGVDNDELLCDFATPSLSSIRPDHERAGYLAGQALSRLFSRRASPRRTTTIPVKGVVARTSTNAPTPSAGLVRRALDFIDQNASSGIGVQDVVNHLHVSRRLADLRFRESERRSIHSVILEKRLELAKRKLHNPRCSIAALAIDCGFKTVKAFEAAFRRQNGISATAWRARLSAQ